MEVELIKAHDSFDGSARRKIERLRVAAYCRVSTDDEDQIKSYNSMVTHYTELIKNNKEWIFSGIYADKAITGTKVDKREEFQRLIQDCMDGKIDMIIAKSLPRFARNTLDTLKYVRMLKERNIAVYFEVEKINTLKDGEFLMTILSSVAQQEVENTSAYVKKGLKMKMKRGELVGFQGCLGYDYDVETKSISINEEGAVVVRYIFDRYVAGAGSTMIARELNEQGHLTIRGNPWTSSSVMGIINNEKYKGDILLGKTFTVDPISKRRLENLGEEDRYYIHDHHEPIITEEQFERAQEMRRRRNGNRKCGVTPGKREKFSRQFAFSCMVECGFCGSNLSRRRWHSSSKYKKTIWQCVKSTKEGKRFCPDSKGIPEQVIEEAFIESYRMLCNDNKDVLEEFLKRTEKALGENSIEDQLHKLKKSIDKVSLKRKKLLDNYLKGIIEQDIYEETDVELKTELTNARAKLEYLQQQSDEKSSLQRRLSDFKKALSHNEVLEEFDRGIFESIVEKVIVGGLDEDGNKDPYKITFIYKTGFKNEIGNAKERFGKSSGIGDKVKKMCSDISDEVKGVCSDVSLNTHRNRVLASAEALTECPVDLDISIQDDDLVDQEPDHAIDVFRVPGPVCCIECRGIRLHLLDIKWNAGRGAVQALLQRFFFALQILNPIFDVGKIQDADLIQVQKFIHLSLNFLQTVLKQLCFINPRSGILLDNGFHIFLIHCELPDLIDNDLIEFFLRVRMQPVRTMIRSDHGLTGPADRIADISSEIVSPGDAPRLHSGAAVSAVQKTGQQALRSAALLLDLLIMHKDRICHVEVGLRHDRLMQPIEKLAVLPDLSDVDRVVQDATYSRSIPLPGASIFF